MSKIDIEARYSKLGSQLKGDSHILLIVERQKTTPNKPQKYLLAKLPDNRRVYISSMYSTTISSEYNIEYLNQRYKLSLSDTGAEFVLIP